MKPNLKLELPKVARFDRGFIVSRKISYTKRTLNYTFICRKCKCKYREIIKVADSLEFSYECDHKVVVANSYIEMPLMDGWMKVLRRSHRRITGKKSLSKEKDIILYKFENYLQEVIAIATSRGLHRIDPSSVGLENLTQGLLIENLRVREDFYEVWPTVLEVDKYLKEVDK